MYTNELFNIMVSEAAIDIGGQSVQQDNGLRFECTGQDGRKLVGSAVFDGHGRSRGEKFSLLATNTLQNMVTTDGFKERFDASPEAIGREIFAAINDACFEMNCTDLDTLGKEYTVVNGLIKPSRLSTMSKLSGGSTGTVVFVSDTGLVHTFNVGDSDAWLVTGEDAVRLTVNHAPNTRSEYNRIHTTWPGTEFLYHYQVKCGLARRHESYVFPKRPDFDGYYAKNVSGDYATVMTVGTHSLAMTRSFGDEPLRHGGLVAEPSYSVHQVTESSIVQTASDGFWDNIKDTDFAAETTAAVQKYGYDTEKLNSDWFRRTEVKARTNFGAHRDNMFGYTVVLEKM
jgi:serine/threonine protein phosphatase PrpC|tara:strand:- start:334 stop:1359 length:1026 start_codon:yes stop_codon:yes gene_type:complete